MLNQIPPLFFAIPLIIACSLVYQGTRSERLPTIFRQSVRSMITLTLLMAVILVVLEWMRS